MYYWQPSFIEVGHHFVNDNSHIQANNIVFWQYPAYFPENFQNQSQPLIHNGEVAQPTDQINQDSVISKPEVTLKSNSGTSSAKISLQKKSNIRKTKNDKKKTQKDPDYTKRDKKIVKIYEQTQGRNKISNNFRAFLRVVSTRLYSKTIQMEINGIKKRQGINVQTQQFIKWIKENIPNHSNYVNKKQFLKLYNSQHTNSVLFRILFLKFIKTDGVCHILTTKSRKKILKQNKVCFLEGLRELGEIQNILIQANQQKSHKQKDLEK